MKNTVSLMLDEAVRLPICLTIRQVAQKLGFGLHHLIAPHDWLARYPGREAIEWAGLNNERLGRCT